MALTMTATATSIVLILIAVRDRPVGTVVVEGDEVCDGGDLNGESCATQGFDGGFLFCNSACDGFDTSSCENFSCAFVGGSCSSNVDCCSGKCKGGRNNKSCKGEDPTGCVPSAEVCDDFIDNDCDGLIDGNDPDCATCTPSAEVCDDFIDNDCDGLIDGNDPDCNGGSCFAFGDSCSSNSDCCSNKCRGPRGRKSCK